jgi:hypothetical protein
MRNKHNSSAQEQKKVRVFSAIQHSSVCGKYLISYKTASDVYVKAYQSARMEDKNDQVAG